MKTTLTATLCTLLIIGCLSLIGLGSYLAVRWSNNTGYTYTGQATFQTEQEYTTFKQAIVNINGDITGTTVLSSSPPIIVNFQIVTTHEAPDFPYGTKQDDCNWPGGVLIAVFSPMFLAMFGTALIWSRARRLSALADR